jgi:hypothetical protein
MLALLQIQVFPIPIRYFVDRLPIERAGTGIAYRKPLGLSIDILVYTGQPTVHFVRQLALGILENVTLSSECQLLSIGKDDRAKAYSPLLDALLSCLCTGYPVFCTIFDKSCHRLYRKLYTPWDVPESLVWTH